MQPTSQEKENLRLRTTTMSRYDIVIYGASGYTGQYVVEHVANIAGDEGITWAVAGRNKKKLEEALSSAGKVTNRDLSAIEKIVANAVDNESLNAMCKRAKVLINCVGPFRFYGEQVVRAAIANSSHHLDISGEPIYLESCQIKYHEDARKAKVYIIGSTGADSIPSEMGVEYLTKNCNTDINGINCFLLFKGPPGPANYGTWQSAILQSQDAKPLEKLRKQLFLTKLPTPKFKFAKRAVFKKKGINKWAVMMQGPDQAVAQRTQYFRYTAEKQRPIDVQTYFFVDSFGMVVAMMIFGILSAILTLCACGRKLLLDHPEFFSRGMFSKEGAPRELVVKRSFEMTFEGEAFDSKIEDPNVEHDKRPERRVACKVSGPDFGYVNCAISIVQCALVVLKESDKLPDEGGVFTPGTAFSKSSLISRLEKQGLKFEMLP